MMIQRFKSKIHRVTVTQADLNYMGSITIEEELMEAANLLEGERVQIVNNNEERLETYVIKGERGRGYLFKRCSCTESSCRRYAHYHILRSHVDGRSEKI